MNDSTVIDHVVDMDEKTSSETFQLVSFRIGEEEYGVDILRVQEINRLLEITGVPESPDFVEGIVNLRGKVIPVISLRKRFGMPVKEKDQESRIIVVDICGKVVGFFVDSVSEVLRLPSERIEPPPPMIAGIDTDYVSGVGKLDDRLLILLDLDKIMGTQELALLEQAAGE